MNKVLSPYINVVMIGIMMAWLETKDFFARLFQR